VRVTGGLRLDASNRAVHTARVIEVNTELIQRQLDKVLSSEQLAKSDTSRKLLSYLVERSLRDEVPKETAIAFDVFGKDPSFNGAEHSIVRVSVRTLRQKLAEYYAGPGRDDEVRFDIPKGGYRLTVTRHVLAASPDVPPPPATPPRSRRWNALTVATWAILAVSLLLNLYLWGRSPAAAQDPEVARIRNSPLWSDMVKSGRPVTVILGDLFMFTQLDAKTGRTLTVRDAGINSSEELRALLASNPSFATERGQRYVTMIQKAVAIGMASVLHIIDRPGRRIDVVARDDVTVDEIRNNDIIYLGPLVRLGPLAGHYALRSRYRYNTEGSTITDVSTGKAFLPEGTLGGQHLDYALAAKFIGPTGNHIMIFTSGARNAGMLQIVRTLTSPEGLAAVENRLRAKSADARGSFEALLTVTGFKQTDLAAEIVEVSPLPTRAAHLQATATSAADWPSP
jgi:hypothetical protein